MSNFSGGKKRFSLYVDDSGNRFPDKAQTVREDGMDYFALGGVLIAESDEHDFRKITTDFKKNWGLEYPLHSTKIRGMRGDFAWLEESSKTKDNFLEDLSNMLSSLPAVGFAAVVSRPGYNKRYEIKYGPKRWWMCKTALCVLLERVAKYVKEQGGVFEIKFEGTGKTEDAAIIKYVKELKSTGQPFDSLTSKKYNALSSVDYKNLILGDPQRKTKDNPSIQIADLYLYPMVKRKYDLEYRAWRVLFDNKRVIDSIVEEHEWPEKGIKYSCFE